jgi:hypothetical protein
LIEKLNRTDVKHLPRLDRVVLPSAWRSELEHSPFPATYAAAVTAPKLLVVDQPSQAFAAYEHGRLVHWGPTSTGRQAKPTPSGRYDLNWRRDAHKPLSGEWRLNWYFNPTTSAGWRFKIHLPACQRRTPACGCSRDAMWICVVTAGSQRRTTDATWTPGSDRGQYAFDEKPCRSITGTAVVLRRTRAVDSGL